MSDLEKENIPIIGEMIENKPVTLDEKKQFSLVLWAMKTAMVLDAVNVKLRGHFYTREECAALRSHRVIPPQTGVLIGAYSESGYSADGTIVSLDMPGAPCAAKASVSTFVIGHFVAQVATIHPEPSHKDLIVPAVNLAMGDWDNLLIELWPQRAKSVSWPPLLIFTNKGEHSISTLSARWRLGKDATI